MVNPFEITLENQAEDEEILRTWRHHWFTFLWPGLKIFGALAIPIAVVIYNIATGFPIFGNVFLFVLWLIIVAIAITYAFYEWVSWWNDVFVLTNYRVIDVQQHGFFDRRFSEASLSNIQDVSHEVAGFFPTMLNYGNVLVQTAGAEVKIRINDVSHPQQQAVYILKEQQVRLAEQDDSLSAEDLIRLLAKHKKDLDDIAKNEKESKMEKVEEQIREARVKKAEKKVKTKKTKKVE